MCKFNNRLFLATAYCLLGLMCVWAKPLQDATRNSADDIGALVALSTLINSQDMHYDQRQKGEENYRIKLDGFFIGLPQEDSTALLLLTDDVFESLDDDNLLVFGNNKHASPSAPASSVAAISQTSSETNQNLSSNADALSAKNAAPSPLLVEIPVSKKYLEPRHNVDSISRTKSYISQFLSLLKRVRKH